MQETAPTATERTSKTDYESKGIYYSNNQPQTQLKQFQSQEPSNFLKLI